MLTVTGLEGTYRLTPQDAPKGKFGGILRGERIHDGLAVSAKKLPQATVPDQQSARQKVGHLDHHGITPTIETVEYQGDSYLIRPYIEGTCFKTILKKHAIRKHLEPLFFVKAAVSLLKTLEHVHSKGLVHRDIKPSNLILKHTPQQHPCTWNPSNIVLIDFEQACVYPAAEPSRAPFALVYSPPEQLLNHNELVCPASDLFALSVTLFELLSGSAPWVDCNAEVLMHLQLTYPMRHRPGIDEPLFEILAKAAYKEPFKLPPRRLADEVIVEILGQGIAKRYQSALDMRIELENYLNANPEIPKHNLWGKWFGK
ncbi:MAG: protein kinase [Breznakibacter sp.]